METGGLLYLPSQQTTSGFGKRPWTERIKQSDTTRPLCVWARDHVPLPTHMHIPHSCRMGMHTHVHTQIYIHTYTHSLCDVIYPNILNLFYFYMNTFLHMMYFDYVSSPPNSFQILPTTLLSNFCCFAYSLIGKETKQRKKKQEIRKTCT